MLDVAEIVLRLGLATLIGAAIGLNRELHQKQTGVRTLGLVALGAATIVIAGIGDGRDPTAAARVIGGVITGLGFLGAGVIVRDDTSGKIQGLTTAAALWVTACVGCACGAGAWRTVVTTFGLAALLLAFGGKFEKWAVARLRDRQQSDDAG